jgi:hypothetical protein
MDAILQNLRRQTHLQYDGLPDVTQTGLLVTASPPNQDNGLAVSPLLAMAEDPNELQ